jgi:hypothetical protein
VTDPNLRPCPSPECGSEDVHHLYSGGDRWATNCFGCGLRGPVNDPTGEKWNALPRAGDDFCVKCAGEFAESLARKEIPQTPVTPRTVRVRIAVAVERGGQWFTHGSSQYGDHEAEDMADAAADCTDSPTRVSFVEADVPLPEEPRVIEGRVVGEE